MAELFAGVGILLIPLIIVAAILLFLLPFFVYGIWNQTKTMAKILSRIERQMDRPKIS